MKFRLFLAAATCLSLPLAAHAQPISGIYVAGEAGTTLENSVNVSGTINGFGGAGKVQYQPGYTGIASVGYGFGDGFRVQLDIDYIHNTPSKVLSSGYSVKAGRYDNKFGPMINVLYDIPAGLPIIPYVGAGVGYQFYNSDYSVTVPTVGAATASVTHGSFAYDIIGGLSYPVASVPGLSLTAEYRFMQMTATEKTQFSIYGGLPAGSPNPGNAKFGPESTHTFTLGARYAFGVAAPMAPAPAPAPAAAPAPAPAKTYLVFFDWDKSNLTPRADQVIAQAAIDSQAVKLTTINVSGYTDTSGTPTYNQGLSMRRAKAVAAKLVADGVPTSEISIHAYGETHLLVPTGPGVREPQNRRVEIVLD
ncbi:MAG: OmpA family protein [Acidocella sp.]|nr:OmpA family protein [Acidocella sp.]